MINSGSSSIKYELFDMRTRKPIAAGVLERIGERACVHRKTHSQDGNLAKPSTHKVRVANHREGMTLVSQHLSDTGLLAGDTLFGIGHRVVHGGEAFREPARIDEHVLSVIRDQIPLAPLHNPANVAGIEVALDTYPDVPQVAVFDTAFHQSIPPVAFRYALPAECYEQHRVRRYGFHGTSHAFVVKQAAESLGRPSDSVNLITLHLGNGASAAAVRDGQCIDTSMGMTPLEGLVMGTRTGDLDPAIVFYLARTAGYSVDKLDNLFNRQSGLKGICGKNDMREVLQLAADGDARAELALQIYVYRIRKYIGAYFAILERVDAVVFTAGIGENSPDIRQRVCSGLATFGIRVDAQRNSETSSATREIQTADSVVRVLVVPTNEELEIADQTVACIAAG